MYSSTIILLGGVLCCHLSFAQTTKDTLGNEKQLTSTEQTSFNTMRPSYEQNLFRSFSGSLNAVYNNQQTRGSFDLSVQTYHYFLITGRRYKVDSIHQSMIQRKRPLNEIYRGVHLYLLNRAALDFDTLRSIANNYISSLMPSPITIRFKKEFFLTKQHVISSTNYAPVISLILSNDLRAVPYSNSAQKVSMGASGHCFLTLSGLFKRLEFNAEGEEIDKGTMYFRPTFGLAFGSPDLSKSLQVKRPKIPILSTECRFGFKSDEHTVKDFSFLFRYTITEIQGPQLRAGIILSSFD